MGNLILKTLKSLGKNVVIFVISILTIIFLFVANIVAFVIYPLWAWRNPLKASTSDSLVNLIGWRFLIDIVNPSCGWRNNAQLRFFQCIMHPIDAAVIKLWNALFMNCMPMKKRKYYIDMLGNNLQSLSLKTQAKYFKAVDYDREVYLIKNNMLSQEILPELYEYCNGAFIEAGKLTDIQFSKLQSPLSVQNFCEKYDLNLQKQFCLITFAFNNPRDFGQILHSYIMRKGLHPTAVSNLYQHLKSKDTPHEKLSAIPSVLLYRQDLVTVQQTMPENDVESFKSHMQLQKFTSYLRRRNQLGCQAQVAMSPEHYKIYHELGFKLQPNAIHAKLARVNKNSESARFVELMMQYGECEVDETAKYQIAGDEKLAALWLNHLSDKAQNEPAKI